MKIPIIRYNHWLPKMLKVNAITLWPFIFFGAKSPGAKLIVHEMKHIHQIGKVGVVRFYVSYLLFYVAYRVQGKDHDSAYRYIPYEKEAYK